MRTRTIDLRRKRTESPAAYARRLETITQDLADRGWDDVQIDDLLWAAGAQDEDTDSRPIAARHGTAALRLVD